MKTVVKTQASDLTIETPREEIFLKKYDEVLNKHILNHFRKPNAEAIKIPDHRAVKIIHGNIVELRLDSIQGQAEGIKIQFMKDTPSMYIWFTPDPRKEKIIFRIVEGSYDFTESFTLDKITEDFFLKYIERKHKSISL